MPLSSKNFVPEGGSYYAHIFENSSTGLPRNLYWSFTVEFGEIPYLDGDWDSSLTLEWITLPARRFDGSHPIEPGPFAEASLYLSKHHWIDRWQGMVTWDAETQQCLLEYDVVCDFPGLDNDPVPDLHLAGKVPLQFDGFIIAPDNLFPKPSFEDAAALVRQYFDVPCAGDDEEWRYVFKP